MSKFLFINSYNLTDRKQEFDLCLANNRKVFDKVLVLDGEKTVQDIIDYANGHSGDINVIANSDVWFENTDVLNNISVNDMWALTRYENNAFFCREDSADAWVFRGRIRLQGCKFRLGLRGTDNALAYIGKRAGYVVTNPSLDVRINHEHAVRKKLNNGFAPQPYDLCVRPCTIDGRCILMVTSINPYDRVREQAEAVQSWFDADSRVRVLSVNTRKEISDMQRKYGFERVRFVERTAVADGKYQLLDGLIDVAARVQADWHVLINSDIIIEKDSSFLDNLDCDAPIIGVRNDIYKDGRRDLFPYGYDVFAMRRAHLSSLIGQSTSYAVGKPWWDFYLPLKLLESEPFLLVDRTSFTHRWHQTRYSMTVWADMARVSRKSDCFVMRDAVKDGNFCTGNKDWIESHLRAI